MPYVLIYLQRLPLSEHSLTDGPEETMTNSISYADNKYAIPQKYADSHSRFWQRLSKAGAWWNAKERIDIAREVRNAHECATCDKIQKALSPHQVTETHSTASSLSELAVEVVHNITRDQSRLGESWYKSVLERGMSDGQYVEIVGTVVAMVSIDSFCLAIDQPLNALPQAQNGEPSGYRPASAKDSEAWVPLIPVDGNTGAEADLWVSGQTGYVVQAMSLVPDEVRTLCDLSAAHYLPMKDVRDPMARGEFLERQQIELIAGRVSALNQCYY